MATTIFRARRIIMTDDAPEAFAVAAEDMALRSLHRRLGSVGVRATYAGGTKVWDSAA